MRGVRPVSILTEVAFVANRSCGATVTYSNALVFVDARVIPMVRSPGVSDSASQAN
jgi:hypothetical protein